MPKTAIVTDSNSGITQADAERYGLYVLPMPFEINGRTYYEDIDLTQDEFYKLLEDPEAEVHTSQPLPVDVMGLWDKLLTTYDEIVHIPMSSGLSGSVESAKVFAEDYDGRVQVVDNQRISVTQKLSCLDAMRMAEKGKSAAEIRAKLEETALETTIFITVDTMTYLKRGGRVTAAAAAIAGVLNIKPVLRISGEKLDAFGKARGMKAAKQVMIKAVRDELEKNYGGVNPDRPNAFLGMAHSHNDEAGREFMEEVRKEFPGYHTFLDPLALSVSCHIGPGSLALTCIRVQPEGLGYDEKDIL